MVHVSREFFYPTFAVELGGQTGADGICLCLFSGPRFFRSCGTGFDKVWDRVEKILRGNFHGRFHRRHRSGFARHAGYLRAGVQLDAGFCASMTTSFGGGLDEAGGRENRGVHV